MEEPEFICTSHTRFIGYTATQCSYPYKNVPESTTVYHGINQTTITVTLVMLVLQFIFAFNIKTCYSKDKDSVGRAHR